MAGVRVDTRARAGRRGDVLHATRAHTRGGTRAARRPCSGEGCSATCRARTGPEPRARGPEERGASRIPLWPRREVAGTPGSSWASAARRASPRKGRRGATHAVSGRGARGHAPRRVETPLEETCAQAEPGSAICVQRFDDSLNSAIRTTYRISLRSSSLREPRYPSAGVVWVTIVQGDPPDDRAGRTPVGARGG